MKNGGVGSVWRMVKSDRLGWGSRPVGNRFALRVLFVTLLALASGVPPSFAGEYDCMVMGLHTLGTVFLSADCTMTLYTATEPFLGKSARATYDSLGGATQWDERSWGARLLPVRLGVVHRRT